MELAAGTMEELGIDGNWILNDTVLFVATCVEVAKDLEKILKAPNTQNEVVANFRTRASDNEQNEQRANELYAMFASMIADEEPEVVACLFNKFSELQSYANNIVTTMAMKEAGVRSLSKRQVHMQYKSLKEGYEQAIALLKSFFPDKLSDFKNSKGEYVFPTIPGVSGNFKDAHNYKLYKFEVDGKEYISPYKVADLLNIPNVHTYMDVIEWLQENQPANVKMIEF